MRLSSSHPLYRAVMACVEAEKPPSSLGDFPIFFQDARLVFALPAPGAERAVFEAFSDRLKERLLTLEGVGDVQIILTNPEEEENIEAPSSSPVSPPSQKPDGLGTPLPRRSPPPRPSSIEGVRHVVAVASGKGGVGKSTTAVNLALGLLAKGLKVGLLDGDVHGPSVPRLLDLWKRPVSLGEGRMAPLEKYGLLAMSMGFFIEDHSAVVWRGPMVVSAIRQMVRDVAWGELDVLVVDLPPGTGDIHLTLVQTVVLSGAVMVSTPQDLALSDMRRGVVLFEKVGVPILGVVENMSYFECGACGTRHPLFHHGGAREMSRELGIPFLGEIPLGMPIRACSDRGVPIMRQDPGSAYAQAYGGVADRVWEALLERENHR